MPGALVEYPRFVEFQQRRSRIVAPERPTDALMPRAPRLAVDQRIDDVEPVTAVDESATRGTVDVR